MFIAYSLIMTYLCMHTVAILGFDLLLMFVSNVMAIFLPCQLSYLCINLFSNFSCSAHGSMTIITQCISSTTVPRVMYFSPFQIKLLLGVVIASEASTNSFPLANLTDLITL